MSEPDDIALLKQYAEGDEAAFTALFERHVHLVYSTAWRQVRNPSHAEEVTQAVFILLARKAKSLNPKTVLSGWLYQAARLTTASLIKREVRRQRREHEVYMQSLAEPDTPLWEQISPLLDDAMGRLGEQDRNAIILRYFENRTPQEVAAALKLNEVTARKRVSRALEKLRTFFAERGVVLTTAIIAGSISANSVQAAPATLANPATALAIAKGTIASGSILTLVEGTLNRMGWAKAKAATIISGVVLFVGAVGTMLGFGEPEIGFRTDDPVVLFGMATLLFYLCSEGLLELLGFHRKPRAKAETKGEMGNSVATFWLFSTVFCGAIFFPLLDATILGWTTVGPALGFVRWFGVPLATEGLIIRLVSRLTLGKQFSLRIQTMPGHRLITTGIYRFIRHPFWLGSIFFVLGVPLCFGSVAGFACGLVFAAAMLQGIRFEEAALAGWFPDEYRRYQERTPRFFPVWTKAQAAIVIGAVLLLAAGTAAIAVKETAEYPHEAWRQKYDPSDLDTTPPQVSIVPTRRLMLDWFASCNGKVKGIGQSVPDLLTFAYDVQPAQLIPTIPVPSGRYDFIANLTNDFEANREALQQEIKKKFGLIGRYETIETNVLVLTVESRNAAGLKPAAGHLCGGWEWPHHYYSIQDQPISTLISHLENSLGTVVIDQTGLTNNLDIDFACPSTPKGLKQVLLDRLGLKLTPTNMPVKMLVAEKAK